MIEKLQAGADTVWALRTKREEPWQTKLFAEMFYRILNIFTGQMNNGIDYSRADFYLLNRKVVRAINSCPEASTSLFGLIIWMGFRQESVDYDRRERFSGRSKWTMSSRMKLAKDWIIAFSGIPLKLMGYLGILLAVLGFLYTLFIIAYSLLGYATPGWAETVVLVLVLGGSQLMMLGVLGEYLWRTLDETRRRPLYFLEKDSKEP
jgi:dolichol-phosphate mannosyltransferase